MFDEGGELRVVSGELFGDLPPDGPGSVLQLRGSLPHWDYIVGVHLWRARAVQMLSMVS